MKKNIIVIICIIAIIIIFGLLIYNSSKEKETNINLMIIDFEEGEKKSIKEIVEIIDSKRNNEEQKDDFKLISLSDENIITIDNNTITAISKGSTIIKFIYNKKIYKAIINVGIQTNDGTINNKESN